ncbi:MAG TPA: sigma-54 dependent transcriptional regulator [Opitutaceae bacterium]
MRALLIGDEQKSRRLLSIGLLTAGEDSAMVAGSLVELSRLVRDNQFGVAILDWEARTLSAQEALELVRQHVADLPVVALVANPESEAHARAAGAIQCLLKPVDVDALKALCKRVALHIPEPVLTVEEPVEAENPSREKIPEREQVGMTASFPAKSVRPKQEDDAADSAAEFTTGSPVMRRMLDVAWRVAPTPASVLILGENGTGKNVLAKAIHRRSERKAKPFVTVHCPCLQEQLLESELFGHVKGAFTGAVGDALGKVAAAEGGTLFLDEIGDLPLSIQPKLLRLLQERKYERVGETTQRSADIRVIAATNRDLQAEVKAGRFREDLYYRLNVVSVEILPLRERAEDILPMADYFLKAMGATLQRNFEGFTPLACDTLRRYRWPGNVRELRNAVERAAILTDRNRLDAADFPQLLHDTQTVGPRVGEFVSVDSLVEEHIRLVIARAASLEHAAKILHIDRSTLYRKRKRWQSASPFPEYNDANAQPQPVEAH